MFQTIPKEVSAASFMRGITQSTKCTSGDSGGTVVKVLCYKSEGRWFDPR